MKAILTNEIIELNELTAEQIEVISLGQRSEYNGKWYFNPDNATISPSVADCPGEYYRLINGEWVLDAEAAKAGAIAKLWQAATAYVEAQINAAEYAKTLSLNLNAKATANLEWYNAVWQDYYTRADGVSSENLNPNFDFSNNGSKPFKFWEVMAG